MCVCVCVDWFVVLGIRLAGLLFELTSQTF